MTTPDDGARLDLAEAYLGEAVFRSRERQAVAGALGAGGTDPGRCGLGERAEVDLDLSERGAELFRALWPAGLGGDELGRLRAVAAAWIARQDAQDRKRNHFLKAFRQRHGFDRNRYAPAVLAEYEAGLAAIASEEDRLRRAAAAELLGAAAVERS